MMLRDQMVSKVSLDRVFVFGVRPPELLLFDKMEWHFRHFERSKKCVLDRHATLEDFIKPSLEETALLDGLGPRVRMRP